MLPNLLSRELSRRAFLGQTGVIFGTLAAVARPAFADLPSKTDILVIGAGAAGLAAAKELHRAKRNVLVVEARDRIGGRIWTDREWAGVPIELGASWIHGEVDNPIAQIAVAQKWSTFPTDWDMLTGYAENGRKLTINEVVDIFDFYNQFEKGVSRNAMTRFRADETRSLADQVQEWLSRTKVSTADRWKLDLALRSEIEQEYGADAHQLAFPGFDAAEDYQGRHLMLSQGYDRLVDYLKEGLSLRLGVTVEEIDYSSEDVKVTTNRGVITAKRVVVTVPLGVLQRGSIIFHPELPETKQSAIDRLGMGLVNKVFLHFDKPFWPKNQQVIFFAWPDAPWPECYNLEPVIGQPILMAIKSGERARRDESKPDAEIVAALKMQLVQVFGAKVPEPLSSRITRWGNDPYSFGSYSFTKVGAISNDYEDLSLPVGEKLFFAGEATSRKHPATVAGAYLSGIREGRRIVSMGS